MFAAACQRFTGLDGKSWSHPNPVPSRPLRVSLGFYLSPSARPGEILQTTLLFALSFPSYQLLQLSTGLQP